MFLGFQIRFLEVFFALATPHGFRSNSKEKIKPGRGGGGGRVTLLFYT